MKQSWTSKERALHIEVVRARAALERQSLASNVKVLSHSLTPGALVKGLFLGKSSRSRSPADWVFNALTLTRRYPLLASSVSAVLSGVGKRRRWWRIAGGLLLSWQLARAMKR
ncbi:MAG TPA: hypothetical protein VNQ97_00830 [Burkholderiaceae bacterium]|nr:hypothetical protein [Burkholderiaceae bacterium]